MLAGYCLRQASHRLVYQTYRSTFATLPQRKLNEGEVGSSSAAQKEEILLQTEPVASNDLLEAQRKESEQKHVKTQAPVVTSVDKFSAGLSPLQTTSYGMHCLFRH